MGKPLNANKPILIEHSTTRAPEAPWANPYWLVNAPSAGRWSVADQLLVGLPEQPPPIAAEFVIDAGKQHFTITRAVDFALERSGGGRAAPAAEVLPPVTIDPAEPLSSVSRRARQKREGEAARHRGRRARRAEGGRARRLDHRIRRRVPFDLAKKGDELVLSFSAHPPAAGADRTASLDFSTAAGESTGVHRVEYPHIPIQTLSPPAQVKLVRVDLKRGGTRIGYVPGAGDDVAAALRQVGYDVTALRRGVGARSARPF